jgi:hypothetical protein
VSYTQADRAWAEWIAWLLKGDGYRILVQAWEHKIELIQTAQIGTKTFPESSEYLPLDPNRRSCSIDLHVSINHRLKGGGLSSRKPFPTPVLSLTESP